jgi:predicted NBD/HSP70 family sugar kinase
LCSDRKFFLGNIKAISIGVPAGVKDGELFFIPDYIKLSGFNLKKYIEEKFNIPVIIENDVNAAILGYYSLNEEIINIHSNGRSNFADFQL